MLLSSLPYMLDDTGVLRSEAHHVMTNAAIKLCLSGIHQIQTQAA